MHRLFLFVVLLSALVVPMLPAFGGDVPDDSVTTLENGMRVVVRERHSTNLAAVEIWVRAGSVNETPSQNGVSHMIEHMLFKATSKYGPGQIDREIEGVGAELNGGTSKDWVHFYTTVAGEYLPGVLDMLADAITNPQFRAEDIEKERQVVLDEIARSESDTSWRAINLFNRAAFGAHPYALPSAGTKDVVKRLTRDDLVSYYKKHYTPENTCVVIVGDVSRRPAIQCVEKAFSGFHESSDPNDDPTPSESGSGKGPNIQRIKWSANENCAVLGFPSPPASEFKEVCAFDVMSVVLGDTFRGRVSQALNAAKIRFDKVTADFLVQRYPSMIYVLVSADSADLEKIPPIILSEFRKLASEEIPQAELSQAKARVEGSDLYEQETFSGQANVLGLYSSIGYSTMAADYTPMVASLKGSDITACAGKYFSGDNYTCIVVGPGKASEEGAKR
jgi:predicted Zn-dependent peptidase